jgi:predicted PurR-regulated permease PerM
MIETFKKFPRWLQLSFIFPLLFLNGFLLAILLNYLQPLVDFLLIASILAFLLELLVELLEQKGIKRTYALAGVIILALLIFAVFGLILIPLMVQQLGELVKNVPEWIAQTNDFFISNLPVFEKFSIDIEPLIAEAKNKLAMIFQSLGTKTLELIISTITSVFNALFIFILTIFLLVAGDKFWQGFFSWFPSPWSEKVPQYLQKTFKDYFFVRLILAGISSVARLIIFLILGVPYSMLFAVGIGIGGLIPFVGGIVTLFGAIILIFKSGTLALWFFISAIIIDQLTDNVLSPRLMGDAIGLNPIWLIISLFIGAKVGGLLGVFLAVPLASVIKQIAEDLLSPVSPVSDSPELVNSD